MSLYHVVSRKFIIFFFSLFCLIFNQIYGASLERRDEEKITPTSSPMFSSTSMPDRDWWQALWPNPKDVLRSIDITPNMVVLDLCCGDGYFTIPLAEMTTKVYGLELDGALLEQATKDAAALNIQNCHWIQGDAMQIANSIPEFVDYVLIANTFHGIPDKHELAPAYDLLSTAVYQDISTKMAMKIGGKYEPEKVFLRHWHQLVPNTEIAKRGIEKKLQYLSKNCLEKAHALKESLKKEGTSSSIFEDICAVIEKRSQRISKLKSN